MGAAGHTLSARTALCDDANRGAPYAWDPDRAAAVLFAAYVNRMFQHRSP